MATRLNELEPTVGTIVVEQLQRMAERMDRQRFIHINSTRSGGGVAEMLAQTIPLWNELGIDAHWGVIEGDQSFFEVTKAVHNALQGFKANITKAMFDHYLEINRENAGRFELDADFIVVDDPQPAYLIEYMRSRARRWIWRCHIDASKPDRKVWRFLREAVKHYDASIFSMLNFAQNLPHPQFLVYPSIDPLSEKIGSFLTKRSWR